MTKISIIAPTFNEADNVVPFVESIKTALADFDWELIFVDDKSSDGTADRIYDYARNDPRVRVVLRLNDRGLAKSSIQGMLSARGDLLCVMDADGQHPPSTIVEMISRLEDANLDVVSAARRLDDGVPDDALSPLRTRMSSIGNRLSSLVLGRTLGDPLTGFFLIRRSAFLEVAPKLGDPGFKLLLDILYSGQNFRHSEISFQFGARLSGESKLDGYVIWKFVTFLLSKLTRGVLPVDLISFLFVGATGLFVHLALLYSMLAVSATFVVAQSVATLVAATSNFLLNNLLTFRDRRLRGLRMLSGYVKFLCISSVGIVANVSAAAITYEKLVHVVFVATLAGIAIDTIWKFVVASRIVWR